MLSPTPAERRLFTICLAASFGIFGLALALTLSSTSHGTLPDPAGVALILFLAFALAIAFSGGVIFARRLVCLALQWRSLHGKG